MDQVSKALVRFTETGAYYVSVSSFMLTLVALVASYWFFRSTLKQYNDQKKVEIEQKKIDNNRARLKDAFEIFAMIDGIRDTANFGPEPSVQTAYLSAALAALRQYPEFHDALIVHSEFYDDITRPKHRHVIWMKAQIDATIRYWEQNDPENLRKIRWSIMRASSAILKS